jgi:hypothetical protein
MVSETFACEVLLWGCGYTSCQMPDDCAWTSTRAPRGVACRRGGRSAPGHVREVKAERDKLAAELAELYPAIEDKLAELLERIDANDRQIEHINERSMAVPTVDAITARRSCT